ncbi:MAG: polysaccharide deacetylase family protein, partial [Selenomonas sp.]|nr:polysaccharide deacetylase family protein [Selenomonas sp.]
MLPALPHYNKEKSAYLTFDDGPDDVNTPAILDVLKANGIHATFY